MVKIDLGDTGDKQSEAGSTRSEAPTGCASWPVCRCMRKSYKLAVWLGKLG